MKYKKLILLLIPIMMIILNPYDPLAATESVTYENKIKMGQTHSYEFSTTSTGVVEIEATKIPQTEEVYYNIVNTETGESFNTGENLPIGDFVFYVVNNGEAQVDYVYSVTGVAFKGTPSTSLPSLTLNSPSEYFTRLLKGEEAINIAGSTSGNDIKLHRPNYSTPLSLGTSFSESIGVYFGKNHLDFTAQSSSGNKVNSSREVLSPGVKRMSGANRFNVSVTASKEFQKTGLYESSVILVNYDADADGTPAIGLSYKEGAPILFTLDDKIPSNVRDEIKRLNPNKVFIVGGTAVVSQDVVNDLSELGIEDIQRISGSNRYSTAVSVANKVVTKNKTTAIIVNGFSSSDQTSVSSVAAQSELPVLFSSPKTLPSEVKQFLQENQNINSFYVIGGTAALENTVVEELNEYGDVIRIGGSNRFETALNIGKNFMVPASSFVIANGFSPSDGIIGSYLGANRGYHTLLSPDDNLDANVENYLLNNKDKLDNIYLIGGTTAISTEIQTNIDNMVQ
ncbi:cell wall-binding repeat-containing protein [Bacillus sp. NTK071]|uniref:cell wall-binding repeat-containing protein n=1 Tax=Bacillus sp. NTK071 TaxID=2802175 RepID=UPI001A908C9F|nr:cell wall-binding repeat-containing protein [Bacillus sp. NTK071]MBN8209856.1 cell wall-binding repeat-containing protein [Bacillus sp. NTK071]